MTRVVSKKKAPQRPNEAPPLCIVGKLPRSVLLAAYSAFSRLSERAMLMLPLESDLPIFESERLSLDGHHETFSPFCILSSKEQLKEEGVPQCQSNCLALSLVVKPGHFPECTWPSETDAALSVIFWLRTSSRTSPHRCIETLLLDEDSGPPWWY